MKSMCKTNYLNKLNISLGQTCLPFFIIPKLIVKLENVEPYGRLLLNARILNTPGIEDCIFTDLADQYISHLEMYSLTIQLRIHEVFFILHAQSLLKNLVRFGCYPLSTNA